MTTTTFNPVDHTYLDLIDTLMHDARPAEQIAEHADGTRLREAVADIPVRDYLASACTDHTAAQRVLELSVALAKRATTAEQATAAYAVAAWAALAAGQRADAKGFLLLALVGDPHYRLAHMIAEAVDRQVPPTAMHDTCAATRQLLTRD